MDKKFQITTVKTPIAMTKEESLFYRFASKRLRKIGVGKSRQLQIINDIFDGRDESASYTVVYKREQYFIGRAIYNFSTAKIDFLEEYKDKQRVLIYVRSDKIAKRVSKMTGIPFLDTLEEINNTLQHSPVIINIKHFVVSVDLDADTIIWFQSPASVSEDIQGSGRITRQYMIEEGNIKKTIIYLYNKNTLQEDWTNELASLYETNNNLSEKEEEGKAKMPFGLSF